MKRKIVRVGASLCILLPKSVVTTMGWDFDDYIDLILDEEGEKVIMKNIKKKKKKPQSYLENFSDFQKEYGDVLEEVSKQS